MPIYEYACCDCGKEFQVLQKMSDPPMRVCESCGGETRKLISLSSFHLKGSGWYVTDYGGKGTDNGKSDGANGGDGDKSGGDGDNARVAAKGEAKSNGDGKNDTSGGEKPAADAAPKKTESSSNTSTSAS